MEGRNASIGHRSRFYRRHWLLRGLMVLLPLGWLGCTTPWLRRPVEESDFERKTRQVQKLMESEDRPRLVGDVAHTVGITLQEYVAFGLVTGLAGTGGDVRPSPQRETILLEMRTHNVKEPNRELMSPNTGLVKVIARVDPGARKGDRLDLRVESSDMSEATSLQNGFLLQSRMHQSMLQGGQVRESEVRAIGSGPVVMTPPSFSPDKELLPLKGLILGGGRLLKDRELTLRIRDDFQHVFTAKSITKSINERFDIYDGVRRRGVATPRDDKFITLDTHPKYRWDISHYMDVISAAGFSESEEERDQRRQRCRQLLLEPTTASQAADQLEAMGDEGREVLASQLGNRDPEIRFYVAYALAYLDDPRAIAVLADLARQEPAFRPLCLIGLTVLDHYTAGDTLERMLQDQEPELRYGALLAMRRRDPKDPQLSGRRIGELCTLLEIPSQQALVTVSLQEQPEIVIFGAPPELQLSAPIEINRHLLITPTPSGEIRLTRFTTSGEPLDSDDLESWEDNDIRIECRRDLLDVLLGIQRLGGTYSDMVLLLDQLGRSDGLSTPIAINPRPTAGRVYDRSKKPEGLFNETESTERRQPLWWFDPRSWWG